MNPPGGPVLVCFALPEEARPFRRHARSLGHVRILVTGMGRPNTERALAPQLEAARPAAVFTCGFAGGLDPALPTGTVLFESGDDALSARAARAGARPGRFHGASRMAITAAEKAALRRDTGADAVEMESSVVHDLCRARGVPCATVRVISDAANEDLPLDFNALTTPDLKIHFGRLAMAVLGAPWKIPALLRLQRQTAAAAATLGEQLVRILREPA